MIGHPAQPEEAAKPRRHEDAFPVHRVLSIQQAEHQVALRFRLILAVLFLLSRCQADKDSLARDACLMILELLREIRKRRRGRPSFSGDGGRIVEMQAAILTNAGPS